MRQDAKRKRKPEKLTVREGRPARHRGKTLTVTRIKGRGRRYQIVIDDRGNAG